jgi:hypothetical protein
MITHNVPSNSVKFSYSNNGTTRNPDYIPPKLRDMESKGLLDNGDEIWGNEAENYLVRKGSGNDDMPETHMHTDMLDGEEVRLFDWNNQPPPNPF